MNFGERKMNKSMKIMTICIALAFVVGCEKSGPPEDAKNDNAEQNEKIEKIEKNSAATEKTKVNKEKMAESKDTNENAIVIMETSMGTITIELDAEKAPKTVANILTYVDEEFYDGTIFHRVISDFMLQCGGFTQGMKKKDTHANIENEAANGLKNVRGSLAMARTSDPHSASSQFFINLKDNDFLNFTAATNAGFGYCVFGKVIDGMDVVDEIAGVKTGNKGSHGDVPTDDVVIKTIRRK